MVSKTIRAEFESQTACLKVCFECNEPATEEHHVVPKVLGGSKTIPLCGGCHGKVHGVSRPMDLGSLIKIGLNRAKADGIELGRPKGSIADNDFLAKHSDIVERLETGMSLRNTAKETGKGKSTVQRIKKTVDKLRTS